MRTIKVLHSINRFDIRLFLWCANSRHRIALGKTAKVVSKTGDGYLQLLLPLLVFTIDPLWGSTFLLCAALAYGMELPLYWILKNSFQRRRPPEALPFFHSVIQASDRFSFPSGHTAAAFLLTTLIYLFYGAAALPLLIWASAVGLSRVLLGVHFPTDILAGALLGSSIGLLAFTALV